MRIDLHMHSTASDGAYTPEEVVQIALDHDMDVIALTDHDTVGGIRRAQQAASGTKLQVLPGIELSAKDDRGNRDLLAYLFDLDNQPLLQTLEALRDDRINRAGKIVQRLAELGMPVPLERVQAQATKGTIGRPHIARVMVEQGYVSSLQEAFDKYLDDDGPANVPHYRLEPKPAIDLVHQAGGVVVLGHPGRYDNYELVIQELVAVGLDGIEVYYPDHTPDIIQQLQVLVRKYNLIQTVGGDFHRREGDGSARIGKVRVPDGVDILGPLKERAAKQQINQKSRG